MSIPIMSLVMVIKGPVAMAGSILNRSRVKGTRVPKMEAKITTANKESRYIVEEKPVVNEYE